MIEHAAILELGELGAHRRRTRPRRARACTSVFDPTGWPRRDVRLDDEPQQQLLSRARADGLVVVAHR